MRHSDVARNVSQRRSGFEARYWLTSRRPVLRLVEFGLQLPTESSDHIARQSVDADLAEPGDSRDPRQLVGGKVSNL
jgi:hypothetical protein